MKGRLREKSIKVELNMYKEEGALSHVCENEKKGYVVA
jgi:hypothetical protein